jgi:hypothetical protein
MYVHFIAYTWTNYDMFPPEDGPSRPKHVVISSRVSNKVHVHIVVLDGIISYLL